MMAKVTAMASAGRSGEWNGSRYAAHSGSWMGTATHYLRNLDSGVSVIVLANGEDLDVEALASAVEEAL